MRNIDPSEINIINYLSGEMTNKELQQFELQLSENQILRQQVEEMKIAKGELSIWSNEDIAIPDFKPMSNVEADPKGSQNRGNSVNSKMRFLVSNWMKYAAVFLGALLLVQVSGFKVSQNGNAVVLSFGEPETQNLNQEVVNDIVAQAIESYAKTQNSQLIDLKSQLNLDLDRISKAVDNVALENQSNIAQLEGIFTSNLGKQYNMIKSIEDNQRQDLEDSFTGLVEYVENNRIKDQYKVQNAFSEIATAINNQQYQTNALLTSFTEEDSGLKSY